MERAGRIKEVRIASILAFEGVHSQGTTYTGILPSEENVVKMSIAGQGYEY